MTTTDVLLLDQKQILLKINRMAWQVWEDNLNEEELVIAGIVDAGFVLAQRVKQVLEEISGIRVILLKITLDKNSSKLEASTDIPVASCAGKVVILIDDVLNSGRTMAYGVGVFLNVPLKKIRTMVLVDRSHRIFPVSIDYVGLELATVLKEHVDVSLDPSGTGDAVYLR